MSVEVERLTARHGYEVKLISSESPVQGVFG